MYRQLLLTDFDSGKTFLILALLGNLFFFTLFGIRGESVEGFMAATIVVYWALLIAMAVVGSEEKRLQLYSQLPLTATEIWLAGWFFVLFWLGLQVCFWLLYGFVFDPEFSYLRAPEIASSAMGIASFIILIAIAIDLGYFKPAYIRWLYIGFLAVLVGIAIFLDMSFGIISTETGIRVLPFDAWGEGRSQVAFSIVVLTLLLIADYAIYIKSDNFLR